MTGLVLLVVMLGLMWAVVILPQQRRVKAHQRLCDAVETGNVVMTTAGVFGTVVEAGPDRLIVETSAGVRTVVDRRSIGMLVPAGTTLEDLAEVSTPTPAPVVPEGGAGSGLLGLGGRPASPKADDTSPASTPDPEGDAAPETGVEPARPTDGGRGTTAPRSDADASEAVES